MSKYVIIHGQFHELSDEELMHWKYVKKEKKNGKWVYYYDVGDPGYIDGWTGKKPSNIVGYSKLEDIAGKDERDRFERANSVYKQAYNNYRNTTKDWTDSEWKAETARVAELGKKAVEARDQFMKTPLGKLDQIKTTIKKAKNFVASLFEKVATKLRS